MGPGGWREGAIKRGMQRGGVNADLTCDLTDNLDVKQSDFFLEKYQSGAGIEVRRFAQLCPHVYYRHLGFNPQLLCWEKEQKTLNTRLSFATEQYLKSMVTHKKNTNVNH